MTESNRQIYLLPYDRTFEFPWERLLLGKQVSPLRKVDHPQIGAGAFGVVHRAVAVGIREGEDQVVVTIDCNTVMSMWFLSDSGGSQVGEATCRKRSAEG